MIRQTNVDMKRRWKKYICTVVKSYVLGTWSEWKDFTPYPTNGVYGGYTYYSLDPTSGKFSLTSYNANYRPGSNGRMTVYEIEDGGLTLVELSRTVGSNGTDWYGQRRTARAVEHEGYTAGTYMGTVYVPNGQKPEQDKYTYVTTFYEYGKNYIVMQSGSEYFCYTQNA